MGYIRDRIVALLKSKSKYTVKNGEKICEGIDGLICHCIITQSHSDNSIIFLTSPNSISDVVCKRYKRSMRMNECRNLQILKDNWTSDMNALPISLIYGYCISDKFILIDKCDTDLFNWLTSSSSSISIELFWDIAKQLIKSIQYCHQMDIVHTDIKLENIGVKTVDGCTPKIKLLDFGQSIQLKKEYYKSTNLRGSKHYTAPEVILKNDIHRSKMKQIDYWELGITLYILLMKRYPFDANTIEGIHDKIEFSRVHWGKLGKGVDNNCKRFIKRLLVKSPISRLNLDDTNVDNFLEEFIIDG